MERVPQGNQAKVQILLWLKQRRCGDYQAATPENDCIRSTAAIGHAPWRRGMGDTRFRGGEEAPLSKVCVCLCRGSSYCFGAPFRGGAPL